jgi:hypothetical protein
MAIFYTIGHHSGNEEFNKSVATIYPPFRCRVLQGCGSGTAAKRHPPSLKLRRTRRRTRGSVSLPLKKFGTVKCSTLAFCPLLTQSASSHFNH